MAQGSSKAERGHSCPQQAGGHGLSLEFIPLWSRQAWLRTRMSALRPIRKSLRIARKRLQQTLYLAHPMLSLTRIMQNIFAMVVVAWLAVISLLVVAYLASLTIEEKLRNRRMNAQRQRLGLSLQ